MCRSRVRLGEISSTSNICISHLGPHFYRWIPFDLMFRRIAHTPSLATYYAHDTSSYPEQLHCKLSRLYDFVETHMIDAAHHQQRLYNQHVQHRSFQVGDTVWLDLLTAGKLDAKWEGGWMVKAVQGQAT